ncbi:MAG: Hpt domain-containing protein [Bdellovibrionota bacterium]
MDWNADPELKKIREEFIDSFAERSRMLTRLVQELRGGGPRPEALAEACSIAHKLGGAAGSYGFENLGRVAGWVDDALSEARAATPELVKFLSLLEELLSFAVSKRTDPPKPASDARFTALEAFVASLGA